MLQISSQLLSAGSSITGVIGRRVEGDETDLELLDKRKALLGGTLREFGRFFAVGGAFFCTLMVSFGIVDVGKGCTPLRSRPLSSS